MIQQLFAFIAAWWRLLLPGAVLDTEQVGFIRRLGQHHRPMAPGWNWKWPVIEAAEFEDGRPFPFVLDAQSLRTADGVLIVARLVVTITVVDAMAYYRSVWDGKQNFQDVAGGELGSAVRALPAESLWSDAVLQRVARKLRARAKAWGMQIEDVQLIDCAPARSYRLWQTQTTAQGQD